MFKVGGVVTPRRKDHIDAAGVHIIHGALQQRAVIPVVPDTVTLKGFRAAAPAQGPGDQRIGRTGGDAQVIFQNIPYAVLAFHQIDARNMAVYIFGRGDAFALGQIAGGTVHKLFRHDSIPDNLFVVIDVEDEFVQRRHALDQALLQYFVILFRNLTGNRVKGEQPLIKGSVFVNSEFYTVPGQLFIDLFCVCQQCFHKQPPK